jgi:hypothetical protein
VKRDDDLRLSFLLQILGVFKELETSLTAYRAFFEAVSEKVPEMAFVLQKAFDGARSEMNAKYDPMLESTSAELSQESLDRVLKRLLAQWKPQGPAH